MTGIHYLLFGLFGFVASCRTSPVDTSPVYTRVIAHREAIPLNSKFAIRDSLLKYQAADSLLLTDDSTHSLLFIGKAGPTRYAVWTVDSSLIFYQQLANRQWLACDTLSYKSDFSFAESLDLNADTVDDVRISTISGAAGNTENVVFLFDNKKATFRHNQYYDLPNIELDKEQKFIKSWWYAGVVHCQDKWKYRITGDSLTFDSGVSYCPDVKKQGETGSLEFYKLVNNKRITTEKYTGDSDKLMTTFLKAFWDASEEF